MGKKFEKLFEEQYKYILIDFFNTIMFRSCEPNQVKMKWAEKVEMKMEYNIKAKKLYNLRILIEKEIRKETFEGEYKYNEIIKKLYIKLNKENPMLLKKYFVGEKEFFEYSFNIEIEIEDKVQYKNKKIFELLRRLKVNGKSIYIISDFYLSADSIWHFLRRAEIEKYVDKVFVSCDYNQSKANFGLYNLVLKEQNLKKSECIMLGDNKKSDYVNSRKLGIFSYLVYPTSAHIELKKVVKNNLINRYSYANYAFSLYLFTERLYCKIVESGIREIYFFAREGELLKKIFDNYSSDKKIKIDSHYLYVSRKSTYLPSLGERDSLKFERLFAQYDNMSIVEFLDNLGFNKEQISKLNLENSFNIRSKIDNFSKSLQFEILCRNDNFIKIYNSNRIQQKQYLLQYLQQEKIDVKKVKKIAVVDIGWKGTIQDNIFELFEGQIAIDGYYLGLSSKTNINSELNHKYGLIFTNTPKKSKEYDIWAFDKSFYERLLFASHPTTGGYSYDNNRVIPLFKDFKEEKEAFRTIKILQEKIILTFTQTKNIFDSNDVKAENFERDFLKIHLYTILIVSRNQLIFQRNLQKGHFENFGINQSRKSIDEQKFNLNVFRNNIGNINFWKDNWRQILYHYKFYTITKIFYAFYYCHYYIKYILPNK